MRIIPRITYAGITRCCHESGNKNIAANAAATRIKISAGRIVVGTQHRQSLDKSACAELVAVVDCYQVSALCGRIAADIFAHRELELMRIQRMSKL